MAHSQRKLSAQSPAGIVSGEDQSTTPGVNILVKGTTIGTIMTQTETSPLQRVQMATFSFFLFVGYVSQEMSVAAVQTFDIVLQSDAKQLFGGGLYSSRYREGCRHPCYSQQKSIRLRSLSRAREPNPLNALVGKVAASRGLLLPNARSPATGSSRGDRRTYSCRRRSRGVGLSITLAPTISNINVS